MIQPKVLPKLLEQINTDGIKATILSKIDGTVLSSVGEKDERTISAITSSIFTSYDKVGHQLGDSLNIIIYELETGRLASCRVTGKVIVSAFAEKSVEMGMLKKKIEALAEYLKKELEEIDIDDL